MRQAATLFIFGLLLLIIFFIFLSHSLAIVQRVAVVDTVRGKAEVLRDGTGAPAALEAGKLVHAGDVIHTGADGAVELRWARWAGGMRIKIGPNTKFTVKRAVRNRTKETEESVLRVDEGTVWVRLRKALSGKSKFEVETPTAVAAVRGTIFQVTVDEYGETRISVWEGTVAVAPANGSEVNVTEGTALTAGEAVGGPPQALDESEREAWLAQTSVIGPFLEVREPAEGLEVAGDCTVSGRTEPDSSLTVNEEPVSVTKEGAFKATVEFPPGPQVLTVHAVAPDGSEATVIRQVTVRPAQPELEAR
jgi:hypothetical protein